MPNVYVTPAEVLAGLSCATAVSETTATAAIAAASAFLDTYLNRASGGLLSQSYDVIMNGTGDTLMFLDNTPVTSIERISTTLQPCFSVHNIDQNMGTRATVSLISNLENPSNANSQNESTGLKLTYITNAVTTTNIITWADNPTIKQVVAAINAAGNHWTATGMGGFGDWSSSDLRSTGAFGARIVTAYFFLWYIDLPIFSVLNQNSGEIYSPMGFSRGCGNYRVGYTAGFYRLPEDIKQVLIELVQNMLSAKSLNSNLQSESLGPISYSQYATKMFEGMSILSRNTVNRYKIRSVRKFSRW